MGQVAGRDVPRVLVGRLIEHDGEIQVARLTVGVHRAAEPDHGDDVAVLLGLREHALERRLLVAHGGVELPHR